MNCTYRLANRLELRSKKAPYLSTGIAARAADAIEKPR
jgi:hypothetical protein